jgi:hypothetical protein
VSANPRHPDMGARPSNTTVNNEFILFYQPKHAAISIS